MMVSVQTQTRLTSAEYLQLPESHEPMQLIDGEIVMPPAPLIPHQDIVGDLYYLLRQRVAVGKFVLAPADVHFDDLNVYQPDMFWISDEYPRCLPVDNRHWQGAPDLVIEVLSSGTEKLDRDQKFTVYERTGVREYWLVHPTAHFIEVYRLLNEQFVRQGVFGAGEPFTSSVLPDFSFDPADVFGKSDADAPDVPDTTAQDDDA